MDWKKEFPKDKMSEKVDPMAEMGDAVVQLFSKAMLKFSRSMHFVTKEILRLKMVSKVAGCTSLACRSTCWRCTTGTCQFIRGGEQRTAERGKRERRA